MSNSNNTLNHQKNDNESIFSNFSKKITDSGVEINPLNVSIKIAGIYFVLGCLWILLSDRIAAGLINDKELLTLVSMMKGWFYVLVSSVLAFIFIFYPLRRIKKAEAKLLESYQELTATHEELEAAYEEITASEEELRQQYDQLIENQQMLIESEARYRLISEATNDGIWEERNNMRLFSDRWFEIMGYSKEELREMEDWKSLIHPEDKEKPESKMQEHIHLKTPYYHCEYRIKKKDGRYIWIQTRGKALFDDMGRVIQMGGSHTDITELKESQEKLRFLAYNDLLTGLPNKLSLQESSKIFTSKKNYTALLFIDMDNFKYINDTMGHAIGDQFIVKVSERLASLLKEGCSLYRLSGDEFIIIIQNIEDQADAEIFASHILAGFKEEIVVLNSVLYISLSIGIALYPEHGKTVEELLKYADTAMYSAKAEGRNKYVVYDQSMNKAFSERVDIEKYLHKALGKNEFEIYYQPQFDLLLKKVTGFEALLRWNSPELGFVPPLKFIKVAEDTHLIIPLGAWVLRNACAFLKSLHIRGYTDLTVSINISMIQLLQTDFYDLVMNTLESFEIEPGYLELELTESILMESFDTIGSKLKSFKAQGVRIALDDFGKGYSSLSYLKQLPISTLKIDKSFIDEISPENEILTRQIVTMGKSMGMCVIAEGVEKQEQLDYLIQNGCQKIQGYLFSKPVQEDQVIELLEMKSQLKGGFFCKN